MRHASFLSTKEKRDIVYGFDIGEEFYLVFLRNPLNSCTFRSKNRIVFFIVHQLLINFLLFCGTPKIFAYYLERYFQTNMNEGECPMNVGE